MADYDIDELCQELNQKMADAPIREPIGDEFVDECAWSRTGWAIWRHDGPSNYCTCRPALAAGSSGERGK